jgi:hypothetical protein
MTIYEFIELDMYEKAEIAWNGTFIADRIEKEDNILLFSLEDFFVEVYYNVKDDEIITIRPFKSSRLLEPYSDGIDISSLLLN